MILSTRIASFKFLKWLAKYKNFLLFLIILVLIVYFNVLDNDFLSDDISSFFQNPSLDPSNYRFKLSTNIINDFRFVLVQLFGKSSFIFHLINIIFHILNVLALYLIVYLLLGKKLALMASSLFAVHPLNTEAVAWVSANGYNHSAFFVFLSLVFFILSLYKKKQVCPIVIRSNSGKTHRYEFKTNFLYIAAILIYLFGLFFSEKIVGYPLVLLFLLIGIEEFKGHWKKLIPFFVISLVWGLIFILMIPERLEDLETIYTQGKVAPVSPLLQLPVAISSYLGLIVFPKNLSFYHSELMFSNVELVIRWGVLLLFLAAIIYFYKKSRLVFFCLTSFLAFLAPMLTPFGISWIVAERYVYLASSMIYIVIALALDKIFLKKDQQNLLLAIFSLIILALGTRTIIRNKDWQNQDTLWLATAKTSPNSQQNNNNLGDYYSRQGDYQRAIYHFKKAIIINPIYADAYHNLANTYLWIGEIDLAIENYYQAIKFKPTLWVSYQQLALAYYQKQDLEKAREFALKSLEMNPDNPQLEQFLDTF